MYINPADIDKPRGKVNPKTLCYHCGNVCPPQAIVYNNKHFCCEGCHSVYTLLEQNNLCNYYNINEAPGVTQKVPVYQGRFAYLDDANTQRQLIEFTDGKITQVTFLLPAIHCTSCIWLLENLHKLNEGFIKSQVNFLKRTVSITYSNSQLSLRKVVELLTGIGYEPHIDLSGINNNNNKKANKELWYKVGVAGFCAGNIMLLSFPEYLAGYDHVTPQLRQAFSYLSLLLALPAFFYSASHIFVSAYKGLQQRILNIDFPVAIGLAITFARSVYEVLAGLGPGFMDSLTGLIFFLLVGRAFQSKTYQTLSFERDYKSYFPVAVMVKKGGVEVSVPIANLTIGDEIVIRNHEVIPADSVLLSPNANIDYSFVTGEREATPIGQNQTIYAGGRQQGPAIILKVAKEVNTGYLTRLWNDDAFTKPQAHSIARLANKAGVYFTVLIFIAAFAAGGYWLKTDAHRALDAFTAILIIACPCGLALTSPFALGNAMRMLGNYKLYLKNADVVEAMAGVDTVVFDKTGTITQTAKTKVEEELLRPNPLTDYEYSLIASVVSQSAHPMSKAVASHLQGFATYTPKQFLETPGAGIQAEVEGFNVKIGSPSFVGLSLDTQGRSLVCVAINNSPVMVFTILNNYREGLANVVQSLGKRNALHILSGDNDSEAKALQDLFGNNTQMHFNQSPQQKLDYIKNLQAQGKRILMVGDGLNDAGALKQANVGIALADNLNNFTPASDAILDAVNFKKLNGLLRYARQVKTIIIIGFIISGLYNVVGVVIGAQGILSPLVAAILMPIASLTVIVVSVLFTGLMAKQIAQS